MGRVYLVLAVLAAVLAVLGGCYWKGRLEGAARAKPKIEAAQAEAKTATLETQGARETVRQVDVAIIHQRAVAEAAHIAMAQASAAKDAHEPLDPDRARRQHDADRELCRIAPDICAVAPD